MINRGTVTGGVVKAAAPAYTAAMVKKVLFTIAVRDSRGGDSFWNCEAEESPELMDYLEREAEPGRGIRVDFELCTRPYVKNGVHKGDTRFLRVIAAEVAPARAMKEEEAPC